MTPPATPGFALWMWAATALPLSCLNVSFHCTVRLSPSPETVAVNVPFAPTGALGLGTSA